MPNTFLYEDKENCKNVMFVQCVPKQTSVSPVLVSATTTIAPNTNNVVIGTSTTPVVLTLTNGINLNDLIVFDVAPTIAPVTIQDANTTPNVLLDITAPRTDRLLLVFSWDGVKYVQVN
jgi:hypothetical protein